MKAVLNIVFGLVLLGLSIFCGVVAYNVSSAPIAFACFILFCGGAATVQRGIDLIP